MSQMCFGRDVLRYVMGFGVVRFTLTCAIGLTSRMCFARDVLRFRYWVWGSTSHVNSCTCGLASRMCFARDVCSTLYTSWGLGYSTFHVNLHLGWNRYVFKHHEPVLIYIYINAYFDRGMVGHVCVCVFRNKDEHVILRCITFKGNLCAQDVAWCALYHHFKLQL